ncbi:hypothetical protein SAMN05877809_101418 [Rhodobacter sp. JA431]|nr:hypothetical protein SAMN05877809_101418 [Rhodobacter sp. JA431]
MKTISLTAAAVLLALLGAQNAFAKDCRAYGVCEQECLGGSSATASSAAKQSCKARCMAARKGCATIDQ